MKRLRRKTNPGVVAGKVQKKNRTEQSPAFNNPARAQPSVHRLKPGVGYRHVLRQKDVAAFLGFLPDWERLSEGLNVVLLAPGDGWADGWYRPGVVAVCAWE